MNQRNCKIGKARCAKCGSRNVARIFSRCLDCNPVVKIPKHKVRYAHMTKRGEFIFVTANPFLQ